jgi:hypothetical protein
MRAGISSEKSSINKSGITNSPACLFYVYASSLRCGRMGAPGFPRKRVRSKGQAWRTPLRARNSKHAPQSHAER